MTDSPQERPRPTPRPAPAPRPTPRKRVAGSRRDRDPAATTVEKAVATTVERTATTVEKAGSATSGRRTGAPPAAGTAPAARRRIPALALVLALLCLSAAAGIGVLVWQRLDPRYVDADVLAATRSNVEDLYAYDYRDSESSVRGKLDALTGDLRAQYETDLAEGGIIDTYEQVSATTRYEVTDVGLQQVNDAQDTATLVVFGSYVVQSATTGQEPAPAGSECQVTPEGAQSCVQTLQVRSVRTEGDWRIEELTVLTTS